LICSYGKEDFIEAAKELGIVSIELQHGVISHYHLGYSYPEGYEKKSFPDYFFAFGKYWRETVCFPTDSNRIRCVGFPFLNKYRREKTVRKDNSVVVISQGTSGKELSDFVLRNITARWLSGRIIYKLHPGEFGSWRSRYGELSKAEQAGTISVVEDEPGLYDLFACAQWVIGVNSTALYEALAFGCRIIVVDLFGHEYMKPLVDQGAAFLARSDEPLEMPSLPEQCHTSSLFFEEEDDKNFSAIMEELDLLENVDTNR
jgi:hypothetical protein